MAKLSLLALPVLLVVVSIIEIRAASLPKSVPETGRSTADFSPALQDRFREGIQGGKRVITHPDKICMADDDGKTVKCQAEFTYNSIKYHQCTHAGTTGDNHHKGKSWCYYKKNGSHGSDWGWCKGGEKCTKCSWKCYECGMNQHTLKYKPLCRKWCSNSNECTNNDDGKDEFGTDCTGCNWKRNLTILFWLFLPISSQWFTANQALKIFSQF